jgi:hypothetical protein
MLSTIFIYSAENATSNSYLPSSEHHLQIPACPAEKTAENTGGNKRRKILQKIPAEINGGKYCRKYRWKILHLTHIYSVSI